MIDLYKESLQLHLDAVKNLADFDMETAITDYVRAVKNGKEKLEVEWCRDVVKSYHYSFRVKEFFRNQIESDYKAISEYYKISA